MKMHLVLLIKHSSGNSSTVWFKRWFAVWVKRCSADVNLVLHAAGWVTEPLRSVSSQGFTLERWSLMSSESSFPSARYDDLVCWFYWILFHRMWRVKYGKHHALSAKHWDEERCSTVPLMAGCDALSSSSHKKWLHNCQKDWWTWAFKELHASGLPAVLQWGRKNRTGSESWHFTDLRAASSVS